VHALNVLFGWITGSRARTGGWSTTSCADKLMEKSEMRLGSLLLTLVIVVITTQNTFAANKATIFYLDEHYNPVVRLDRLGPMTDALRAILAMYTLQSGAGCVGHIGKKDGLNCALTHCCPIVFKAAPVAGLV